MIADILAIQELYGRPNPSSSGDTIYGQNGNTGTYLDDFSSLSTAFALTIFEAGGATQSMSPTIRMINGSPLNKRASQTSLACAAI